MNKIIKLVVVVLFGLSSQVLMAMSTDWKTLSLGEYGSDIYGRHSYALEGF